MKKLIFLTGLLLGVYAVQAQTFLISGGGTASTCYGDFFDSGDYTADYGNNENFTMTFHSTDTLNPFIKVTWNVFDVDAGDTLYVYDGSSIAAPLLGAYNYNHLPGVFTQASVYNLTGDLTFRFRSDASVAKDGWWGIVTCSGICQTVIAKLDTIASIPSPHGGVYLDVCQGASATFAGTAAFPQNNVSYSQNIATSVFVWDYGDGTAPDTGQTVQHSFGNAVGYDVKLQVTDSHGCVNSVYPMIRVRVSHSPFHHVDALSDICSGSLPITISADTTIMSDIQVVPYHSGNNGGPGSNTPSYDSVKFIPDGPNCPPGYIDADIAVNGFLPGAVISGAGDIISVLVNVEHSFAGDLGFTLFCPNGQSVVLDGNDHSGGAYLGDPYGGANHSIYDNGCLPPNNMPGTGWLYGWSMQYPNNAGYLNVLDALYSYVLPIDTVNQANYFIPDSSFESLTGCPLNGIWTLRIMDNWFADNGYIFGWSLNLGPQQPTAGWTYVVPIDTMMWSGTDIDAYLINGIIVSPDIPGMYSYTLTVTDEYGCSYDTSVFYQVVLTPQPNLGPDTIVCSNVYYLDAGPGQDYLWSTMANTQTIPVFTAGFYTVTVGNYNPAHTMSCLGYDTVFVQMLPAVNVYIGPDLYYFTGNNVTLDAGNPGYHYQWNTGETTQTIIVNQSGHYCVTVSDPSGVLCPGWDCMEIYTGNGFDEPEGAGIFIYPNPAKEKIVVEYASSGGEALVSLLDIHGRSLISLPLQAAKTELSIAGLAQGMYYLKIEGKGGTAVRKVLKE